MTLSYKYKVVERVNKIRAPTPSIPINLSNNGTNGYEFMVLIDSGADVSAIPKSIAELLNLDLSGKQEKSFGIGGEVPSVETKMHIEFGKGHEKYSFYLPVKVIMDGYEFPPLIGRAVFFEKFNITFKQSDKRVQIKEANKNNY